MKLHSARAPRGGEANGGLLSPDHVRTAKLHWINRIHELSAFADLDSSFLGQNKNHGRVAAVKENGIVAYIGRAERCWGLVINLCQGYCSARWRR